MLAHALSLNFPVVIVAALAVGVAAAQEGTPQAPTEPVAEPVKSDAGAVRTEFEAYAGHQFRTDLDTAGDVSASRAGGRLGVLVPVGEHDRLTLDLSAQATFYSFEGATGLHPSGDPVGTVENFGISGRYFHRLAERWGVYGGAGVSSSGEPGAKFSETLQYGGGGGFTYFFSESLSVSPGVFVRSQLEEGVLVVPMVNIDWKINEQWRLATIFRAAGTAPGLALSYSPSEQWTFSLAGSYENRSYRLDDEGAAPGGVFRDRRVPIDLSARWNISRAVSVEATAGVSLLGEFRLRDSNGDFLSEEDLSPAPFVGLALTVRF